MRFDACGPFEFPKDRVDHSRWKSTFWKSVDHSYEKYFGPFLSKAIGCYVFSIDNGKSSKPWYVGLTLGEKGFEGEIFQKHKLEHFNEIVASNRGSANITLFPLLSDELILSWSRTGNDKRSIQWLEKTLIGMALSRNPEIRNSRDTKFHREVFVNGVLGKRFVGRPENGARYASELFIG